MELQLNLDDIKTSLKKRWEELQYQLLNLSHPDANEFQARRSRLKQLLASADEEIIEQKRIRDDEGAATVVIQGISQQELDAINSALADLNKAIQTDEVWHRTIEFGTAALDASAKLRRMVQDKGTKPAPAKNAGGNKPDDNT